MNAYFLWTATGPQLILTSCDFIKNPDCLKKLSDKGISKFIAHEVPLDLVKQKYGAHFEAVLTNPKETDELRFVDMSGERVLSNFSFKELGWPISYEPA